MAAIPLVRYERESFREDKRELRAANQARERESAQLASDSAALRTRGIASFTPPLTATQTDVLTRFIESAGFQPSQLDSVLERYGRVPAAVHALAGRQLITPAMLERVYRGARQLLAAGADTTAAREVVASIAANPNVSVALLTTIIGDDDALARHAAAQNPRMPQSEHRAYLERAATSTVSNERWVAAADTLLPAAAARTLAADPLARAELAKNPSIPPDVLTAFAADPAMHELLIVNRSLTPPLVRTLAASPRQYVRTYAQEWLQARDSVLIVGVAAFHLPLMRWQLEAIANVLRTEALTPAQLQAAAPQLDSVPELIEVLLARRDVGQEVVRSLFDVVMRAPNDAPSRLAGTLIPSIGNLPNLPSDLLEQMLTSETPEARMSAWKNPRLTPRQRTAYEEQAKTSAWLPELEMLASDSAATPSMLAYLATDPRLGWSVASNSATPPAALRELARSEDVWAAALAVERLRRASLE